MPARDRPFCRTCQPTRQKTPMPGAPAFLPAPCAGYAGFLIAARQACIKLPGMTHQLQLTDHDILAGVLEDHRDDSSPARHALDRANALLDAGDLAGAAGLCIATLAHGPLHAMTAANLTLVLAAAGEAEVARVWQDDLLAQLARRLTTLPDDAPRRVNLGRLQAVLGRLDLAEAMLTSALAHRLTDQPGVLALTSLYLKSGRTDAAIAVWAPLIATSADPGARHLDLVKILASTGHLDAARAELAKAAPLCSHIRAEVAQITAGLTGGDAGQQAAATLDVFDRFAPGYDKALESLGNQGPAAVGQLLGALPPKPARKLTVLDAGCGTGLCGPLLRPYARRLFGVDLSAPMLGEARKKRCYDALARCDLSLLGTYPAGPFDLIVSSDTLVYFGDLAEVLGNMAQRMTPGGWLIVTLEDGDAGARPWAQMPSGRYRHRRDYLEGALQKAGFAKPRHVQAFVLRHEFGQPIAGLGLAAQRLALFG
jgi:predicted TPR repeat methyltransferase